MFLVRQDGSILVRSYYYPTFGDRPKIIMAITYQLGMYDRKVEGTPERSYS